MTNKSIQKNNILNPIWKPSLLVWLIGVLSIAFIFIASGKVIKMFGETDPFINKVSGIKEQIFNLQLLSSKNDKIGIPDSNKISGNLTIEEIIQSLENIKESSSNISTESHLIKNNFNNLINELRFIKTPYEIDSVNHLSILRENFNRFENAKLFINVVLGSLKEKQSNDYNRFKYFRILIIVIMSFLFLVIGVIVLSYNKKKIADYEKIQTALSKVEEQKIHLENLINSTPAAIAVLDTNDVVIRINSKFTKLFGYSESQVIGEKISDLIVPKELFVEGKLLSDESNLRKGISEKITLRKNKDGHLINVLVIGSAILVDDKFVGVYGIYQDISERMKYEEELLKSKEIAENADKLKSVFLAQMSHEIRTPINAMVSLASLLKDDLKETVDEDQNLSLELINKAGNRIIRTVDLLLNLSELQAGTYQTIIKTFDIYTDVLSKLVVDYKKIAAERGIDLTIKVVTRETELNADSYTVNQIFTQLIDNAVKYTEKGNITINIKRNEKNNLIVEVADTGIGIADDYLSNLFEPFSQEEMGYSRKYEGNGIGLTLVKKYCDLNRAFIEVESKKDKGSIFRVIFNSKNWTV